MKLKLLKINSQVIFLLLIKKDNNNERPSLKNDQSKNVNNSNIANKSKIVGARKENKEFKKSILEQVQIQNSQNLIKETEVINAISSDSKDTKSYIVNNQDKENIQKVKIDGNNLLAKKDKEVSKEFESLEQKNGSVDKKK